MSANTKAPNTVGTSAFDPDVLMEKWATGEFSIPSDTNLRLAIIKCFSLKESDTYVYHAIASVTLAQVQQAINFGSQSRLHAWYLDEAGNQISPPAITDIEAYISIFLSTTRTSNAMTAFEKNAKKDSTRANVASNLTSNYHFPSDITIPKLKKPHINPYLDFWAWSCRTLEWTGPDAETVNVKQSHHILPIFYHHFGCVCPSYDAIKSIELVAKGRRIVEIGSGNGYWTYLLRRMGLKVEAIDNGDSLWRTSWIGDTIKADGAKWLAKEKGAEDAALLLVYPQVSTEFTQATLKAFKGKTICVAGTQNRNGFTAFKDLTIDNYMAAAKQDFKKIVQIPLPSFAAKDEALFIFHQET